jgi:LPS O-antigen subunit length determinant protein (WzzB/FepE family)
MKNSQKNNNDELDLRYLVLILWRGKFFMILVSFVSVFLAALYLQSAERKYTVEYNLKPVGETNSSPSLSGFGGFASIAGIQLPSSSSNDFNIFKKLITSTEVSEIVFNNKEIVKDVFKSEWNASLKNYSIISKSKIQILVGDFKKLLTGNKEVNYMPPSPKRLSVFIANTIQIKEDKNTGFLTFISETSKPELMLSIIIEATKAGDKIMRQRYIDFSTEPLAFYKEKIRTARSREHREALAELIGKEEQKLMFASRGKYFMAEPYVGPTISLYPTAPKPKLILALSFLFGLFISVVFISMWHVMKKDN